MRRKAIHADETGCDPGRSDQASFRGSALNLRPVNLNTAAATAGATGGTAGSPTPSGSALLGITTVSTTGAWPKRSSG